MSTRYVVDTHTLLWYIADERMLGKRAGAILDDPTSQLVLPAIVLAEACYIIEQGKVSLALSDLLAAIDNDLRITLIPLDRTIVERTTKLTVVREMHDRQIVATALVLADQGEDVIVLTKDMNITTSGVVTTVW